MPTCLAKLLWALVFLAALLEGFYLWYPRQLIVVLHSYLLFQFTQVTFARQIPGMRCEHFEPAMYMEIGDRSVPGWVESEENLMVSSHVAKKYHQFCNIYKVRRKCVPTCCKLQLHECDVKPSILSESSGLCPELNLFWLFNSLTLKGNISPLEKIYFLISFK